MRKSNIFARKKEITNTYPYNYFLLIAAISFIGWILETAYCYFEAGRYCDRGFLTLPLCPIYGFSLLGVYFFAGTPDCGGIFLKRVRSKKLRLPLYFAFSALLPTFLEFITGLFFYEILNIRLWNYSSHKFNIAGHICLSFSLIWGVLITLFMKFCFNPLKKIIFKIPPKTAKTAATALITLIAADLIIRYFQSSSAISW